MAEQVAWTCIDCGLQTPTTTAARRHKRRAPQVWDVRRQVYRAHSLHRDHSGSG